MDSHEAEHLMRKTFKANFMGYVENGLTENYEPLSLTEKDSIQVYVPKIAYHAVENIERTNNRQHWLRFSSQNVNTFQASLAGGRTNGIPTKFTTTGVAKIEIYISMISYKREPVEKLKTMVQKAFLKSHSQSLWFRNVVIVNVDPIEQFFRCDVLAEFQYDFTL